MNGSICLGFGLIGLGALVPSPVLAQIETPTAASGETMALAAPEGSGLPDVEPIIPDAEFEAAIPDFPVEADPELESGLESIADFERRLTGEYLAGSPEAGLAPEDDPARDAELARPLQPLDQFELAPVTFVDGSVSEETETVAYRVVLEGLEEADGKTPEDIQSLFRSLSALRGNGRSAVNIAMVRARLNEDVDLVRSILESQGWYGAKVRGQIDRPETGGGPLTARMVAEPGDRYRFSEIRIETSPAATARLARDSLALKVGQPIVAGQVLAAEANLAVLMSEQGYPFVDIGQRDILLDRATAEGVYTLPLDTGPRSVFGGFETQGDLAFGAEHLERLARFKRGDPYDSRKVDDLRKALVATGLFATVSVEPRRGGEAPAHPVDGDPVASGEPAQFADLFVQQKAGPPRTIAGTAGYATGEGFRLEASWTHRNLFPPEGALIARGVAGTSEQGGGVIFRRANAGRRDRTFEVAAEVLRSDFDAFDAYTGRLGTFWRYESTPIWQKRFTWALGAEVLATAERDFDPRRDARNRRTFFIGALSAQAGADFTDTLLDPTRGFRLTALVQPEGSLQGGFNPYVRARLDGSAYWPVTDSLVLAGRFRLGTIQGADRFSIAPSRRFYAGGGGSVRGFGYQQLGQSDPDGNPIGGRALNELAAEVRYRFGDFGVVGFVDAGQTYQRSTPDFSDLRFGAGIGARYYTNFGPMRLDVATPIDRRPGESRFNLYISIGQAF